MGPCPTARNLDDFGCGKKWYQWWGFWVELGFLSMVYKFNKAIIDSRACMETVSGSG
jgi:hypothetical protein